MNNLLVKEKVKNIFPKDIQELCLEHFNNLMAEFYTMQNAFLSNRYKIHHNLETTNILLCFTAKVHLAIIRQREKNLHHSLSLDNFFHSMENIEEDTFSQKIVSIVNTTGIPKETVRRKLKLLLRGGYVLINRCNEYRWCCNKNHQEVYRNLVKKDINAIAKFIASILKLLNLKIDTNFIKGDIEKHFSFYFNIFINCQLTWFKMWQTKIKDIDLIFIIIQVLIPSLQYADRNKGLKNLSLDKIYTIVGKTKNSYVPTDMMVSTASISEVTGIPRATCIRKLETLVKLGVLRRESITKRYFINQTTASRTKNLLTKENITDTISIFSNYLAITINSLTKNIVK